jgi:hypothetical protein
MKEGGASLGALTATNGNQGLGRLNPKQIKNHQRIILVFS